MGAGQGGGGGNGVLPSAGLSSPTLPLAEALSLRPVLGVAWPRAAPTEEEEQQ